MATLNVTANMKCTGKGCQSQVGLTVALRQDLLVNDNPSVRTAEALGAAATALDWDIDRGRCPRCKETP